MHAGQRMRIGRGKTLDQPGRVARLREIVKLRPEGLARLQDVGLDQRRMLRPALAEEIATEQGAGPLLHQQAAIPAMRQMRRVEPAHGVAAQRHPLLILKRARRPVGDVADRDHCPDLAAQRNGVRRHREEFVERTALVRLEVLAC